MISLLSPAKNMDFSKNVTIPSQIFPVFMEDSDILMSKLKKLSARQLGKLMNLNAQLSDLNFERNQRWNKAFENNDRKEAVFAFNGEVYRGLMASEFSSEDLAFASEHLLILSGLHGVLRPLDLIQPYRLEMGSKIKISSRIKNLYEFWGDKVSDYINQSLRDHKEKAVINLASNEYSRVLISRKIDAPIIDVKFLDWKDGTYKSVMTWAKLARGMLASTIIKGKIDRLDAVKDLNFGNYSYNESLSSDLSFVFTREHLPNK